MVDLEQHWVQQARRATFEDYRRRGVSTWIAPRGTSMRPLVGPDTWMLVEFGAATIEVGDIVLFPLGDLLVAHRVVARRHRQGATELIPKGDAEPYCDQAIQPADVLGVVRALRQGAQGRAASVGCTRWTARIIARLSHTSGRGAWKARRVAALLPDPLRRTALRAIPPFARVVARILFAPLLWAAWYQRQVTFQKGRG